MPRPKDPLWGYAEQLGNEKNKCKFCDVVISGGISRLKYHWAKLTRSDVRVCTCVTDQVIEEALKAVNDIQDKPRVNKRKRGDSLFPPNFSSTNSSCSITSQLSALEAMGHSNSTQPKVMDFVKKKEKEIADILGVEFAVANNLDFNIFRSEELRSWCLAIGQYGPGYVPPRSETARTNILGSLKYEATLFVKTVQASWKDTGCTLMSDSWSDAKRCPHVNLVASSPGGIVFLKSVCLKGEDKQTGEFLANFIMTGMEEIGAENVVQIVTDNAKNYGSAGRLIEGHYPCVFKTTCVAHGLDLVLEEIDKNENVSPTLNASRKIVTFLELKRPANTRFATNFLCLQSVLKEQEPLRFLVNSNEWKCHRKAKYNDTKEVVSIIQSDDFWEQGNKWIKVVEPIVKVLRTVDSDQGTLGYIYEAIERVKKTIKTILKDDPKQETIEKLIEFRRKSRIHHPIHVVAAYLNPKLYYEKIVQMNDDIIHGLGVVRHRLLKEGERKKFTDDMTLYHTRNYTLFTPMAVDAFSSTHPRLWWEIYGGTTPIIRCVATRLLGKTCSSSASERNWSAFEAAHTKKRNKLEPPRLSDLVFFRMNLHMQKTAAKKMEDNLKPIDIDGFVGFPDNVPVVDNDEQDGDNGDDVESFDGEFMDEDPIDTDETQPPSANEDYDDRGFANLLSSCM